jgi:uncharacterized protein (UPF0210 family)
MFQEAGFEVHTRRLVLPAARANQKASRFSVWNSLASVSRIAGGAGVRWFCQPFAAESAKEMEEWNVTAVGIVRRFPEVFINFLAAEDGMVHRAAVPGIAKTILDISKLSRNGFDNFRVGAGCNLRPNTPFFPFSNHTGPDCFTLAVEAIEAILQAMEGCAGGNLLARRRGAAAKTLETTLLGIDEVGRGLQELTGIEYRGLDVSIAPFPDERRSLANLFKLVGLGSPGHAGTLAVTSFFTDLLRDALRKTGVRAAGFNGVMFSPLEDSGLAAAGNARLLTLDKLLLWSTVCGCGIDMVPVPGNAMPEEVASLVLDAAALSLTLHKPLGVRVLPIPGADVNEMTNFNHDFLVNTRVFALHADAVPLETDPDNAFRYLQAKP